MVRISGQKLIIEIDCGDNHPLQFLGDFQTGLTNMIEIANVDNSDNNFDTIDWGIKYTCRLLKEMLISADQLDDINKLLTKQQTEHFNKR